MHNNTKNTVLGRRPKRYPVATLERIPTDPNLYQIARTLGVHYSTVYRWWRFLSYPPTYGPPLYPFPRTWRRDEGRRPRLMSKPDLILFLIRSGRVEGVGKR